MRLTQRQIEIFNSIMIYKSTISAAEALGTSQPTVSRELRELEAILGFELFNRFGKRLTPTSQALLLHSAVSRSFVGMQEITRVALSIRQHDAAHLRIASLPAYAEAFLPLVARRFLELRSQVHLSVHLLEEIPLRHDLTTQIFDIGLIEGSFAKDTSTTESIAVGEVVCVLPVNHPLTSRAVLMPSDFEGVDFIYYTQEDPYRRKIDQIFAAEGISPRYRIETTTATGICSMVAAGLGVSMVNPLTAAHYDGKGIALRRFGVSIPYELQLWRPPNNQRSSNANLFVTVMQQIAQDIRDRMQTL